ncbi:hypothetical protein KP509_07G061700 [Ceratopteris richardii]|uniref:Pentatricopeptide repeat-containing protein n=1 Tax=Ceratopteris richardii TaxID=49495 RepID=A0A8T2UIT4_CERRI|nr:hypothetical protein KP509_07G061700 [Ceratopteris richardii]
MQSEGISLDAVSFLCILNVCSHIGLVDKGKKIHDVVKNQGLLQNNVELGTALVDMYAKCGSLSKAKCVFDSLLHRDVVCWNALIVGYMHDGQGERALDCFKRMKHDGITPDATTYACMLKACASIGACDEGQKIHDEIERQGLLEVDIMVGNALVDMYAKCGKLSKAQEVLHQLLFRDVVSWNALITGFAQGGLGEQALSCFEKMQSEGISPDAISFLCILNVCSHLGLVEKGKKIHDVVKNQGLLQNNVELGTALVDMYAKCGALSKAKCVFDSLLHRDVVCWNALIIGYMHDGQGERALDCFKGMKHDGITPDATTCACMLKACASICACDEGQKIHDEIERQGLLEVEIMVGNALVDMYAKFGRLSKAQEVLHQLPFRDVASWNALITGFAQGGSGEQALSCFEKMQSEGISPDAVSFLCILNVCSHLGLVDKGYKYFVNMTTKYGIIPNSKCFTCIIDLFGCAGHLEKAV